MDAFTNTCLSQAQCQNGNPLHPNLTSSVPTCTSISLWGVTYLVCQRAPWRLAVLFGSSHSWIRLSVNLPSNLKQISAYLTSFWVVKNRCFGLFSLPTQKNAAMSCETITSFTTSVFLVCIFCKPWDYAPALGCDLDNDIFHHCFLLLVIPSYMFWRDFEMHPKIIWHAFEVYVTVSKLNLTCTPCVLYANLCNSLIYRYAWHIYLFMFFWGTCIWHIAYIWGILRYISCVFSLNFGVYHLDSAVWRLKCLERLKSELGAWVHGLGKLLLGRSFGVQAWSATFRGGWRGGEGRGRWRKRNWGYTKSQDQVKDPMRTKKKHRREGRMKGHERRRGERWETCQNQRLDWAWCLHHVGSDVHRSTVHCLPKSLFSDNLLISKMRFWRPILFLSCWWNNLSSAESHR